MQDKSEEIIAQYQELFAFVKEIDDFVLRVLKEFNLREIKLFELPAYKRIFLFIFTRAIKSYSAICALCQSGYGQDVSTVLRSLLENLITAKYIVHDEQSANDKAKRFVEYKWIIFKKHLPEEEKRSQSGPEESKAKFRERKAMIMDHVDQFKKRYLITSDRALLTWSGKTVKDMARQVEKSLMEEYEATFRMCSRFSHPSILGDNEYIVQDDNKLIFSGLPSGLGITSNFRSAIHYYLEFLATADTLFSLNFAEQIQSMRLRADHVFSNEKLSIGSPKEKSAKNSPIIKESIVSFEI